MQFCKKDYEAHKECFTNGHCCYDCPNFACDEIEERFDIPCEDAGYSRIRCEDCSLNPLGVKIAFLMVQICVLIMSVGVLFVYEVR